MTTEETGDDSQSFDGVRRIVPLLGMIAVMWVVQIVNSAPGVDLTSHGIHPRSAEGLPGMLFAPFLHSGWGHLLSNTAGLLILGALVLIRGIKTWAEVTLAAILGGGLFTFAIGQAGTNHIGASGIVFAYFGYLLGAAVFERSMQAGALALVAIMFYGSLWFGLVPQQGVSWAGHAGGVLAGAMVAYVSNKQRRPELEHA